MFWKHVWMADNDAFDTQAVLHLRRENCPVDPVSDDHSMLTHLAMNISMYNEMKTGNIESLRSSVKHAGGSQHTLENQVLEGTCLMLSNCLIHVLMHFKRMTKKLIFGQCVKKELLP